MTLAEFLTLIKKAVYSMEHLPNTRCFGNTIVFGHEKDKFAFQCITRGENPFYGEESAFEQKEHVWILRFFGKYTDDLVSIEQIEEFRKKALAQVDPSRPCRGPDVFEEGDFKYKNTIEGPLSFFKGIEIILYKGRIVYSCEYHGGSL